MEIYTPTLTVAGILGFLAPLVSTALSKLTWPGYIRQLFAIGVAAAMAIVSLLITDGFSQIGGSENPVKFWLILTLIAIAVAQIAYRLIWTESGVDAKLAAATATRAEKDAFLNQNTVTGETVVDSTESDTAKAVLDQDQTPTPPGYQARH